MKVHIAYEISAECLAKIKARLDEISKFDPSWSGISFEIEREEFTCLPDTASPDALVLMQEIFAVIRGEKGEANSENDESPAEREGAGLGSEPSGYFTASFPVKGVFQDAYGENEIRIPFSGK